MTKDQAIRSIVDGTVALEGDESPQIDVTLIREPDNPQKLERYYRQHGWVFVLWQAYRMDDGAGMLHLRRQRGAQTEAEVLYNCFESYHWFHGKKRWEERVLLAGSLTSAPEEISRQLNEIFSAVPADAVRGRKGWAVAEIVATTERGTVRITIRKDDSES